MEFLFKTLIKNHNDVKNPEVRDSYGKVAGIVGIVSNLILCTIKYAVGVLSGSIAIIADAVNNLADASSSVITLIGFKLASMPEDEEHPYGHARVEYIAGMIVSMIIIVVGVELGHESVLKIINPEPLDFSWAVIVVLLIAIGIKVWQAFFNITAGKKINSIALIATGTDSRNDVIATSVVLLSIIVEYYTNVNIDGYMGVLVAAFIVWSGISLTKETISPLLGESPDPNLIKDIAETVESYEGVLGIHDLMVHDYGPGKIFCSVHVEVDRRVDVMESHDLIDTIEFDLRKKLNILVTIHMDPIDTEDPHREPVIEILNQCISNLDGVLNFHDLRFVPGDSHTNVICDLLLSPSCKLKQTYIHDYIQTQIKAYDVKLFCVFNYDISYVG